MNNIHVLLSEAMSTGLKKMPYAMSLLIPDNISTRYIMHHVCMYVYVIQSPEGRKAFLKK